MIGLSGGKDSLLLSLALASLRKRSPVKFELARLHDRPVRRLNGDRAVLEYMDELGIPVTTITHPTYQIMKEREERSPCSLCANMRRGMLANAARAAGCGVLALGHHKDDAAETVLMNLFYGGRFKCFHPAPLYEPDADKVIRPMIYIEGASDKA